MTAGPVLEIVAAGDRFHTALGWLDSHHSFSFGPHHDPANVGHGLLIVSNDDRVAPGGGFSPHSHRDMEIVTWVLEGRLEHRDSEGNHGVLYPGLSQRMSAGSGITHSEMNASADEAVHLVQMWVVPDAAGIAPGYEEVDVNEALAGGHLVAVASGQGHDGAIALNQRGAVMWVGRLVADESVELPDAPFVHLFVARGSGTIEGEPLATGDAARLTNAGTTTFTADVDSEIIVWETDSTARH
ncbi:MAG: pirin family protein [Acidimicrobiia bacterium]|nr:pirin family protein [Acidimicrobiia bacterium]